MYFDRRLFALTRGLRGRILLAVLVGLVAVPVAVWRLTLTGTTLARIFRGEPLGSLAGALALIAVPVVLRALLELLRDEIGNQTALRMKLRVRHLLYEHVLRLGP